MIPKIRLTHTGLSEGPIRLNDVDFGFDQQNRKVIAYVPEGGTIELPYTSKSAFSFEQGDIRGFTDSGYLLSIITGFGTNSYAELLINTAGIYDLVQGFIQRYDPSGTLDNTIILRFPEFPLIDDTVGIKEVADSTISIFLDGRGNLVEGVGLPTAITQNLDIGSVSLQFKWDGLVWRII